MSDVIVNKVAESGLVSLDLQDFLPAEGDLAVLDLKDFLFMGLILKEKDFRTALQSYDWTTFTGRKVAVFCSADAIIPAWAYMLVATYLEPIAALVFLGDPVALRKQLLLEAIAALPAAEYADKRVVVKGCGDAEVPPDAYLAITLKLRPVAKSIMYGEPCSTVPVFKRK
ncbi:DUF2480 family protein [Dinghuibacter silviterrae]|uniref:Uncharacterized protein DUF2480 n=1 Tax=Dinghuibacter silviterrae TaxID=1539049 RepID=A0A4R8DRD1_9BACT|nr:DUF2480 family protein [Dinghuibacter silviterrae]TDW99690.1 uncharacterized protein DUF2480 [Dinghuibacter silviterrae]